MRAGPARNLIVVGAVLLLLGVVVGLTLSLLLGVLLVLASLGVFAYQTSQSAKAARDRERGDDEETSGEAREG